MLRSLASIRVSLDELAKTQETQIRLLHKLLSGQSADTLEDLPDMQLPLKTVKDVEELEGKLKDPTTRRKLVCCIVIFSISSHVVNR